MKKGTSLLIDGKQWTVVGTRYSALKRVTLIVLQDEKGKKMEIDPKAQPEMAAAVEKAPIMEGVPGKDAPVPQRGIHYWTKSDIDQITKEATAVLKASFRQPLDGEDGKPGEPGKPGENGKTPKAGIDYPTKAEMLRFVVSEVSKIPKLEGTPGKDGKVPAHKWEGTKLFFQNPDGKWGEGIDLRGRPGDGGDMMGGSGGAPFIGQVKTTVSDETPGFLGDKLKAGSNVTITEITENGVKKYQIASTGGGSGGGVVETIVAGSNITVDATDPANPIVSVETLTLADISDVTASVTEINYVDGVTSAIQTQLDAKLDDSQATAFGLSLLDDANAAAGRTTLGLGTAAVVATDLADLNEATIEGAIDTLANLTSIQGRTITLADAGADALLGWDDSASAYQNLSAADAKTALSLAKGDVGLGNVDNTSDANKPVSTATQTALDLKAPLASPTFSGTVTLPVGLTGVLRADTGVVSADSDVTDLVSAASTILAGKVELATDAETNTGTDTTRAITPANLTAWTGDTNIATVGTITAGTWNGTDIAVADGGTGRSTSTTAYGLIAAGTTATGAHQTLAAGATTEILVGGGASALPVWTTAQGSGAPVRATSPTLTTPNIGTPSAGVLTNCTGLPAASVVPGTLAAGTYLLAENASIGLDPAGSADGKYSGITVTGTGGATIAFGDLVTLDKDDSRWELVDISVAAAATGDARGIIGIAVTSSTDGGAITVLLNGIIRADANFPALTIGAPVYASTTGDVVVTQPTTTDHVIRIVGYGLTADEMYFNPGAVWTTHT